MQNIQRVNVRNLLYTSQSLTLISLGTYALYMYVRNLHIYVTVSNLDQFGYVRNLHVRTQFTYLRHSL